MNYFNYQPEIPMGRIWSMFYTLGELSEEEILGKTKYESSYSHTLEIVNSLISKAQVSSLPNEEEFNLGAYETKCKENDKIDKLKSVDKLLYIVDSVGGEDEEEKVGYGDISENRLKKIEEAFDTIEALASFESNLNELLNIRNSYITTKGIDLVSIISSSLKGIPEAIATLSELVKNNSRLKDLITSLCEDGDEGILLKRLSTM